MLMTPVYYFEMFFIVVLKPKHKLVGII